MKNEPAGATLSRICEERGMRRKDMAEALSVSPSVLSEWISGIKRPSGDNRALIEMLYGVESRRWTPADQLPRDVSAEKGAAA
jgi:transcriptional regulator with XRE-family HTH domain